MMSASIVRLLTVEMNCAWCGQNMAVARVPYVYSTEYIIRHQQVQGYDLYLWFSTSTSKNASIKTFFCHCFERGYCGFMAFIGQTCVCMCVCVSKWIGPFVSCCQWRDRAEGARTWEAKYTSWYGMVGSWPLTLCPHGYLYCNPIYMLQLKAW